MIYKTMKNKVIHSVKNKEVQNSDKIRDKEKPTIHGIGITNLL